MDFPKSVPGVGLVNGEFIDEDPLAATPGSLIPSVWGNSVTHEILNVIKDAGLEPAEADNTQLSKAIKGLVDEVSVTFASQEDAEAGTDTTKAMSAKRVFQAIAKVVTQATEVAFGWLKIATLSQANSGTDDATAITPKKQAAVIQTQTLNSGSTGGTATAYTLTGIPGLASYVTKLRLNVTFHIDSGANPTINVNGLGDKRLKRYNNVGAKVSAVVTAGFISDILYDGTDFLVMNQIPVAAALSQGQCKLGKVGANIVLSQLNGNNIIIGGAPQIVPSTGVSLAPTGLTPGILYYIYAFMSAGVMTLEASAAGHATDADTGVEIKLGDASRTLVGMVRPVAGPAFQDTAAQRFVLSYFNRVNITASAPLTANVSTSSATYVELSSVFRCEYLSWGNEQVKMKFDGSITSVAAVTSLMYIALSLDATALQDGSLICSTVSSGVTIPGASSSPPNVTEGYHFTSVFGRASGGQTLTCLGASSAPDRCVVKTTVRG
ncbi:hypothetical protein ICY20_24135 [Pseudomonas sp. P115]|uniref:hypothetical protein n=1 Tax=Pseudomonas pisciculturae TaxID=2730413 RepID=UPI0018926DF6|nr:hypothetical protein [Pseudomonas pisciculturae]MBF6030843.1 hypothetical protein [Pseudomonas pisciculturae]